MLSITLTLMQIIVFNASYTRMTQPSVFLTLLVLYGDWVSAAYASWSFRLSLCYELHWYSGFDVAPHPTSLYRKFHFTSKFTSLGTWLSIELHNELCFTSYQSFTSHRAPLLLKSQLHQQVHFTSGFHALLVELHFTSNFDSVRT